MKVPSAFISYRWEDEEHKLWVRELATKLSSDGVNAVLDQWETAPGDQLAEFMESAVRDSNFVLIICTPGYKAKADRREGGVGYEGDIMTAEVFTQKSRRKFIPILRGKYWNESAPSWLLGSYYIDLSDEPYREDGYEDLLSTLHRRREIAPPVGPAVSSVDNDSSLGSGSISASFDSTEWQRIWKTLIDRNPHDEYLTDIGRRWLKSHPEGEQWVVVWRTLIEWNPHDEYLADIGRRWLKSHPEGEQWVVVWRTLIEWNPHDEYLADIGRKRLQK